MVNKGEKRNSFFGYERGGSRKKNSYELQQLYTTKRENKTRAKHELRYKQSYLTNKSRESTLLKGRSAKYVVISASGIETDITNLASLTTTKTKAHANFKVYSFCEWKIFLRNLGNSNELYFQ